MQAFRNADAEFTFLGTGTWKNNYGQQYVITVAGYGHMEKGLKQN